MDATPYIRSEIEGAVCILRARAGVPQVLSPELRASLFRALGELLERNDIQGVVIACEGSSFLGGVEIEELGSEATPTASDLAQMIASFGKPVIAAIEGGARGEGLELALAASFRIAKAGVQLALPAVTLGALPGAGGIVRSTLLAGPEVALELAGGGAPMSAEAGRTSGLVDEIVPGDPVAAAIEMLKSGLSSRRLEIEEHARDADIALLEKRAETLERKLRSPLPRQVLSVIRHVLNAGSGAAFKEEQRLHDAAIASPRFAAMRHVFLAERRAATPSGAAAAAQQRPVSRVGVIGSGTMGGGIAMAFAKAGYDVLIADASADNLSRGLAAIDKQLARSVARGTTPKAEADAQRSRIQGTVGLDRLADRDLVIEAAFEDMDVKTKIFADLDRIVRPGAILATNTSYLDVNVIAAATSRPADVLGMHFFAPAHIMSLLELVRGRETAADVLATALGVCEAIGKQPVVVGVGYGFVGNRMLSRRNAAVTGLVLEGASPAQIDGAFRDLGWPMGPCQMGDLVGLDVMWRVRQAAGRTDPVLDRLYEMGRHGQKNGKGWYAYGPDVAREADPEVAAMIEEVAARQGIVRRPISDSEIIERTHSPMIDEGYAILDEGVAAQASDIDVIYVHGYGFPRGLGGPMYWDKYIRNNPELNGPLKRAKERSPSI